MILIIYNCFINWWNVFNKIVNLAYICELSQWSRPLYIIRWWILNWWWREYKGIANYYSTCRRVSSSTRQVEFGNKLTLEATPLTNQHCVKMSCKRKERDPMVGFGCTLASNALWFRLKFQHQCTLQWYLPLYNVTH